MTKTVKALLTAVLGKERFRSSQRKWVELNAFYRQNRHLRRHGRALFNFWEHRQWQDAWFLRFLDRPRLRVPTASRKIAFISVFGPPAVVPRINSDVKIFFTGENLDSFPAYRDHLDGAVDVAIGFDYLDRSTYVRFPIWLLMCFSPGMDRDAISARLRQFAENRRNLLTRPKLVATLLAKHDKSGIRGQIADLFSEVGEVRYGGRFRNPGPVVQPGTVHKQEFIRQFPFQICPENSARNGYVTEKIFQAVAAGCIPIYWGADIPPEPEILNERAILFYDPDQPRELIRKLETFRDDSDRLREFRDMSPFQPGAADRVYAYYSQLEDLILRSL